MGPKQKTLGMLALILCAYFIETVFFKDNNQVEQGIEHVFSLQKSGEMITIDATVVKLLKDDLKGDKHQKMILRIGNNTLLLAHNIDIAPRVPAKEGDKLLIKGQYEWNEKGGLVHWTHRSNNSHPHGWIKHNNKKYQ